MWNGDHRFLLRKLILKDFKIRYRSMSLGAFWSLLNPLVMVGVYTFVFAKIFKVTSIPHFPLYIMSGVITFNFFAIAWVTGTTSLVDNAVLIKRLPIPREIVPIASVFSNCIHLGIQIAFLLLFVVFSGLGVSVYWLWLPLILGIEIVFICGISLITSGLNVYVRDTRYIVESLNLVAFWCVPIMYAITFVPVEYRALYDCNPVAAAVMAMRSVLIDHQAPSPDLLSKFVLVSFGTLLIGLITFRQMRSRFYDYL